MSGIYFNWTEDSPFYSQFGTDRRIGLSAQNVQNEFPELVTESAISGDFGAISDFHWVWYDRMAGVFVQAVKELNQRISDLENNS